MLLAVDVGNTQTHFGAFDGERPRRALALRRPVRGATGDELGASGSRGLLALRGIGLDDLDAVDRLLGGAAARRPSTSS